MDFDYELNKISFLDGEANIEQLYDFVDRLQETSNKRDAVSAIFRFVEKNFDKVLGSPGPLVHFLEEENDYINELKESIARKPTDHTVWMVNRIINAAGGKENEFWMAKLAEIVNHPKADSEAKESAKEFIEYQREKI